MSIKRVRIVEGCISCNLCEDLCPEIFEVPPGDTSRTVKGHEKLLVRADLGLQAKIVEAVESCPVEVIEIDRA
jgi:ferredoxin